MPRFDVDPVSIDVDVDEFWNECRASEKDSLRDIVADEYHLVEREDRLDLEDEIANDDKRMRSLSQQVFNHNLWSLRSNWYSVSKEDADIINIIAKKYGAL